ncbi:MAG: oxygen-independent coproporphyrinogen III oxidase-like protein, partial [Hydrogenovibrio crunogenus]|nr:oxygen-independent coproporphyrinogen III oxidase-like protein [Hydrogenovibrio crunogenus]
AHGKITQPPLGEIWRTQMPASPGGYMNMIESGDMGRRHILSDDDALFEFMLNALRLQDGFPLALFTVRTGLPLQVIDPQLKSMISKGWAEQDQDNLQLTQTGKTYLNEVLQLFLP